MSSYFITYFWVTREPPCCHVYTYFGVWPRNDYMLLQRFTQGSMSNHAKDSPQRAPLALLKFPHKGSLLHQPAPRYPPCAPSLHHQARQSPEVPQISEHVVAYQTRDDTCYPGWSLQEPTLSWFEQELSTNHENSNHPKPYHPLAQTLTFHVAKKSSFIS
jgi:hypothetical protein